MSDGVTAVVVGAAACLLVFGLLKAHDRLGQMHLGSAEAFWNRHLGGQPSWYWRAYRSYFTLLRLTHELFALTIPLLFVIPFVRWPLFWFYCWGVASLTGRVWGPRVLWRALPPRLREVLPLEPAEGPPPQGVPRTYWELFKVLSGGGPAVDQKREADWAKRGVAVQQPVAPDEQAPSQQPPARR